ncbi:MAG: c-type cytochrome [Bacteroidales bacterium]
MKEKEYIQAFQWTVAIASALLILLLLIAWIITGPRQEWRQFQRQYLNLSEQITDSTGLESATFARKGIHQLESSELKRIDRCVTCHMGIENPHMKNANQPFASHPGDLFTHHPPDKYGCTICHGGQGRALNMREAHGIDHDTHWDQPLLSQTYIQSSCGKCHLSIFSEGQSFEGIAVFREGQKIFEREGCLGCHKARGVGGIIGPDLTEQGEKTRHEYSFQNIETEQTISNWLKEHFRDPEMVSPGSQMLKIDLPEEELDALTTFVLGLAKPDIAFEYFSLETLNEFKGNRSSLNADRAFSMACSGCHGREGAGKSYEEYKTGVPAILGEDFQRVASPEYIEFTLLKGRSQRDMASWDPSISGLRDIELQGLNEVIGGGYFKQTTVFVTELFRQADAAEGEVLFEKHCAACHGNTGNGGTALALNNPDLLRNANDEFLFKTLVRGRENATMPSWQNLEQEELYDLVKYLRTWQAYAPRIREVPLEPGDQAEGRLKYHFMCSRCHGEFGQGQTGPALINRGFMEVASDEFLYNTIAFGRDHTAMFGWTTDVYNAEVLARSDIGNIIAFIREQSAQRPDYIYAGANPGATERGGPLYKQHCAECHGRTGEGEKAPALNNQELLSAASNGYLMATITVGREGTEMPAWSRAGEDHPVLTGSERQDIVAWIRHWQRIRIGF